LIKPPTFIVAFCPEFAEEDICNEYRKNKYELLDTLAKCADAPKGTSRSIIISQEELTLHQHEKLDAFENELDKKCHVSSHYLTNHSGRENVENNLDESTVNYSLIMDEAEENEEKEKEKEIERLREHIDLSNQKYQTTAKNKERIEKQERRKQIYNDIPDQKADQAINDMQDTNEFWFYSITVVVCLFSYCVSFLSELIRSWILKPRNRTQCCVGGEEANEFLSGSSKSAQPYLESKTPSQSSSIKNDCEMKKVHNTETSKDSMSSLNLSDKLICETSDELVDSRQASPITLSEETPLARCEGTNEDTFNLKMPLLHFEREASEPASITPNDEHEETGQNKTDVQGMNVRENHTNTSIFSEETSHSVAALNTTIDESEESGQNTTEDQGSNAQENHADTGFFSEGTPRSVVSMNIDQSLIHVKNHDDPTYSLNKPMTSDFIPANSITPGTVRMPGKRKRDRNNNQDDVSPGIINMPGKRKRGLDDNHDGNETEKMKMRKVDYGKPLVTHDRIYES
jgi:hypothetical protein